MSERHSCPKCQPPSKLTNSNFLHSATLERNLVDTFKFRHCLSFAYTFKAMKWAYNKIFRYLFRGAVKIKILMQDFFELYIFFLRVYKRTQIVQIIFCVNPVKKVGSLMSQLHIWLKVRHVWQSWRNELKSALYFVFKVSNEVL